MFCYQCEETARGTGCTVKGVCGKEAATAGLMDVLIYLCKGIAERNIAAAAKGKANPDASSFIAESLFATLTNTNFDDVRLRSLITQAVTIRDSLPPAGPSEPEVCTWTPANDATIAAKAEQIAKDAANNDDVASLRALLLFGLKGVAAYYHHAQVLGYSDKKIEDPRFRLAALQCAFFLPYERVKPALLGFLASERDPQLLDTANTKTYGNPEITSVKTGVGKRPGILITGHDLKDLEQLLGRTEGMGIDIYTHGEMLPAHGYPGLKKFKHLVGNYGGAWQDQIKEFAAFPGAILMTTNCIQKPRPSYMDRIYTTGLVAWPGVVHLPDRGDFSQLIAKAVEMKGFAADEPGKTITVGFGHEAVLGAAEQVKAAVQAGTIRHFFLIGGCDGAKSGRNYYTEFAEKVPSDCLILTLACGKYRFNKLDFGDIDGIPRLLDIGQCNDAYSAIKIAVALANAFGTDVNGLPLSLVLSWYEQKAVAILLTLLHLGIKNIRLGPTLPAFVTPDVLDVLVKNFNIMPIGEAKKDLEAILS